MNGDIFLKYFYTHPACVAFALFEKKNSFKAHLNTIYRENIFENMQQHLYELNKYKIV